MFLSIVLSLLGTLAHDLWIGNWRLFYGSLMVQHCACAEIGQVLFCFPVAVYVLTGFLLYNVACSLCWFGSIYLAAHGFTPAVMRIGFGLRLQLAFTTKTWTACLGHTAGLGLQSCLGCSSTIVLTGLLVAVPWHCLHWSKQSLQSDLVHLLIVEHWFRGCELWLGSVVTQLVRLSFLSLCFQTFLMHLDAFFSCHEGIECGIFSGRGWTNASLTCFCFTGINNVFNVVFVISLQWSHCRLASAISSSGTRLCNAMLGVFASGINDVFSALWACFQSPSADAGFVEAVLPSFGPLSPHVCWVVLGDAMKGGLMQSRPKISSRWAYLLGSSEL